MPNIIGSLNNTSCALAPVIATLLLVAGGCTQETQQAANADTNGMQRLAETGDRQSLEILIDGLEDESEDVRREAGLGLEKVLKRKMYFDPKASPKDRAKAIAGVRRMWQNLQERNLVEAVKQRMPLAYYYDLNTGELFEDLAKPGPVETASGPHAGMPAGLRAVVFACRDCGDEADRYVAWLEIPAAKLEEYEVSFNGSRGRSKEATIAVRRPEGGDWALTGTPQADAITTAARRCDNRPIPLYCRPGR